MQRAMLKAEGIAFGADGTIDLAKYQWKRRAPERTHSGL